MQRNPRFRRFIASLLILPFTLLSAPQAAWAGAIGTQALLQSEQGELTAERLRSMLARDDVKAMLEQHGVSPEAAAERVAALTETEIAALQQDLDELPAGGVLEVLGVVLVVLIVLELLGVTNVFSRM